MIAIEPAPLKSLAGATLRKRELSRFVSCASKAIGLTGEVSVLLTGDDRIRALNRQFRGLDKPTDVLSFPAAPFAMAGAAGDLAISLDTAERQAAAYGHTLETEVKVLMLHGLLHLAGFDHETDAGEMARREIALRKQLELPVVGLIERERASPQHAKAIKNGRERTRAARTRAAKTGGQTRATPGTGVSRSKTKPGTKPKTEPRTEPKTKPKKSGKGQS
jgi:probable rRNA maturation factor